MNRSASFFIGLAIALLLQQNAVGVAITVTIDGVGSGSIGSITFNDSAFRVTTVGDTSARRSIGPSIFDIPMSSATFDLPGFPTASFTQPTRIFTHQGNAAAGFSRDGQSSLDIMNVRGPQFATWSMLTGVGPVFDPVLSPIGQAGGLSTSRGTLTFTSCRNGTFLATLVPEPTVMCVLGTTIVMVVSRRWRSN